MTRRAALLRRPAVTLALIGLVACGLSSCAPRPVAPPAASSPPKMSASKFSPLSPTAASKSANARDRDADALWRRTRQAEGETPLAGRVRITRWQAGRARVSTLDVVEGTGGKFRLTYTAPAEKRGRILASDGKTLWQYQPRERTLLRKPALRPDASESGGVIAAQRVPGTAQIAGRRTSLLILSGADGKLRARRWVDDETGRTLRTDEYGASGHLQKRVEMTEVTFHPGATAAAFAPIVPSGSRVVTAHAARAPDAGGEARRLSLPDRAGSFRLRSVLRPGAARMAATQVLYSDGARALSVFVQENVGGAALRPSTRWQTVKLGEHRDGFAREEDAGTSVAWVGARNRYVAVAHVPLSDLLPIARALADRSEP